MVTDGSKGVGHSGEVAFTVMPNHRCLSVHDVGCLADGPSRDFANCLMAETYAKDGGRQFWLAKRPCQNVQTYSTLFWSTGSWREHDAVRIQLLDLGQSDFVVSAHDHFFAALSEILDQVVRERIEIVDDEDHWVILARGVDSTKP